MKASRRIILLLALTLLTVSSCDCEQRVRGLFGGSGSAKKEAERAEKRRAAGESSAPREQEPNDTAEEANAFALGGDLRPIRAEISSPKDRDWFAFTSQDEQDWQVSLTIKPLSSTLNLVVRVDVPGSPDAPIEYHLAGPGEAESIPVLALSANPQRIMVLGADQTTGEYEISFQKRLSGGDIEAEPNDDIEAATPFKVPGTIEGFYDRPDDRDIFFVPGDLLREGVYQIELTSIPGIVQQVRLYTRRDLSDPYLSFQVGPERPGGLPNLHVPAGVEGLWIALSAGSKYSREHSYRLSLMPHPQASAQVELEPNDTADTAQKISLGAELSGYFHAPEDVDYFRVYAGEVPDDDELSENDVLDDKAADALDQGDKIPDAGLEDEPDVEDLDDLELENTELIDPLDAVADKEPPGPMLRAQVSAQRDDLAVAISAKGQGADMSERSELGGEAILCNMPLAGDYVDLQVRPAEEFAAENSPGDTPAANTEPANAASDKAESAGSGQGSAGARDFQDFDYTLVTQDISKISGIEVEPNDSAETADKLPAGEKRVGFLSGSKDVDVFAIGVPFPATKANADEAPGLLGAPSQGRDDSAPRTVEIALGANPANLAFELRDDEGGVVARVDRAGAGGEERLKIDLPPGLYFVHVSGTQTEACKPYEITYALLP